MEKIKVAICDDMKPLCDGFCEQFALFDDIEVVGVAYSAADCIGMLEKTKPDVLLLDVRMETERAGIEIIPTIKKKFENVKILMLTSYNDSDYIFTSFVNGADNYCEKSVSIEEIVNAIRSVHKNESFLQPAVLQKFVDYTREVQKNQASLLFFYNNLSKLTAGEYELLRELYYGNTYKNIASNKYVSIDSVRKMAKRVRKHMGVKSMNELLLQMRDMHVFEFLDNASLDSKQ